MVLRRPPRQTRRPTHLHPVPVDGVDFPNLAPSTVTYYVAHLDESSGHGRAASRMRTSFRALTIDTQPKIIMCCGLLDRSSMSMCNSGM